MTQEFALVDGKKATGILFQDGKRRSVRLNNYTQNAPIIHGRSSKMGRGYILAYTNSIGQIDWKFVTKG